VAKRLSGSGRAMDVLDGAVIVEEEGAVFEVNFGSPIVTSEDILS